jgi:hypothetical protein
MKTTKYKYNVINKFGLEEPWSGVFENIEMADRWYEKHGKFHEKRGHKLVRRIVIDKVKRK